MKIYIAFLRAVNVGGTGKLPMSELRALCEKIGFQNVKTYIASGNVLFHSNVGVKESRSLLEAALKAYAKKEVGVVVRNVADVRSVLQNNPFPDKKPNHTVALFLNSKPPKNVLDSVTGVVNEELVVGNREIYIHYSSGMAGSKLKFSLQSQGTARNMNTIGKMVELADEMET